MAFDDSLAPDPDTTTDPWTDDELNATRTFGADWMAAHSIPDSYGTPDDVVSVYKDFRRQGMSHDDARQGAINYLGWDQPVPGAVPEPPPATEPPAPTAPAVTPPTGPTAPAYVPPPVSTVGGGFDTPPPATAAPGYTPAPPRDLGTGVQVPGYVPDTPVFVPPAYVPPPEFAYDEYTSATPFAYDDYAPTTAADLSVDPSYQFRVGEGLEALTNSAAARGVANTGGTLKDFINYGENAASQEFGAVDARRLQNYTTNRANAFANYNLNETNRAADYTRNREGAVQRYNTNYQTQYVDPYKISYTGAVDAFTPKMTAYQTQAQAGQHESDQDRSYDYQTWLQQYNMWRANRNDTFDEKYRITALQ